MQGPNPERPEVIATPKHFDVHSGPESTRHVANVFVSKHDLVDTYLPAFRAAITEAKAGSIMCAYNRIDGQPACANDLLLKHYLRGARSEEHTSELQSLMRISYAVFCLKQKTKDSKSHNQTNIPTHTY